MPFNDCLDGINYITMQMSNQCWMAENLNYLPSVVEPGTGSNTVPFYYVNGYNGTNVGAAKTTANYQNYGALYNWPAALTACPTGWHLPTDAEWTALTTYVSTQAAYRCDNSTSSIAKSLAATTNWAADTGSCTVGNNLSAKNATGFTGLPGGVRSDDGNFYSIGSNGNWWSSTEYSTNNAWFRDLYYYSGDVSRDYSDKANGFSVRCLRD